MKKIHFIMPSMVGGGAERVVSVLANYFSEKGNEVVIHLFNENVIEYNLSEKVSVDLSTIRNTSELKKKIYRLKDIRKIIKMNPDGYIISFFSMYNIYTLLAGIGLKTKIVVSERLDPRKSIPNKKFLFVLRNKLYAKAHRIVFQTLEAKEFFPDVVQKKGIVIANPLKENLPERFIGERKKEIVTFARLEPQKNYPLLINAYEKFVKEHADYKLSIYGKGTMEETLKALVREKKLEDKIEFKGFCANLHDEIRGAAMFVLPSDYEGLSNSMLEALAIGLPCVCTDCPPGGAKMFINNEINGLLVPVQDVDAMCKAMSLLAEDKELREKISINATKIREDLTVDNICEIWNQQLN